MFSYLFSLFSCKKSARIKVIEFNSLKAAALHALSGKILASGCYRHVYAFMHEGKEYVIKIDRGLGYKHGSCYNEIEFWERAKDTSLGAFLAPILLSGRHEGKYWVVMPRMTVFADRIGLDMIPSFSFYINSYLDVHHPDLPYNFNYGVGGNNLGPIMDLHEYNFGFDSSGKLHILDYAQ